MKKFTFLPEFANLSSAPATPTTGFNKPYYHSTLQCLVNYDETRSLWLSDQTIIIEACRNGSLAAGSSFRIGEGIPTSTTPILIEKNICLVGISASTSVAERFVIRVDDVSGIGSGATLAINYEVTGPTSTQNFSKLDLNTNYTAGDTLDIYILSSATGNVSNPYLRLFFKYRA